MPEWIRSSSPSTSSPGAMLVFLLLASAVTAVPGQTACGGDGSALAPLCTCTVEEGVRNVDCSGLGLTTVPPGIPDDTVILDLSENSIEEITSEDLSNLVSLRELYIKQNALRSDLLPADAFRDLQNLEWLDLNGNRIILGDGNEALFLPLEKLRYLDLGSNNIATIDPAFVTILDRLDSLILNANSLVCDCNLLWFKNWLLNKRHTDFGISGALCYTPASVRRQAVALARFCIPVQRCYFCNQASTNAACNFAQQQCSGLNPACQNEVRINNGQYLISKACQELDACLTNSAQNQNDCNSGTENSVCRYCCQGDKCNAPESAILNGYQFPFPDELTEPSASTTEPQLITTQTPSAATTQLPPTTTQPPPTTTQPPPTTTQPPPTTTQPPPTTTQPPPTTTQPLLTTTQSPPTNTQPLPTSTLVKTRLQELVCESRQFSISCANGGLIEILWALYGREAGTTVCQIGRAVPCGDPAASQPRVEEECEGKQSCRLPVTNSYFRGDPCRNVGKYLIVHYVCLGEERSTPVVESTSAMPSTARAPTSGTPAPTFCPAEVTQGATGMFLWPETLAGDTAIVPCAFDLEAGYGTRACVKGLDGSTGWDAPDTGKCPTAAAILEELSNVTISEDNALDVSETLTDVTTVPDVLKPDDVTNVVDTFENLANALNVYEEDSPDVLGNVLEAVDQLTRVPSDELVTSQLNDDSSSRLLRSIDDFNLGVRFPSNVLEENTPSVDVVLVDITDPMDSGLLFYGFGKPEGNAHPHVVSNSTSDADEILASNKSADPDDIVKGSLFMPNSLLASVGSRLSRCQFVMFEETTFFDIVQEANKNRTITNEQVDADDTVTVQITDNGRSEVDDGTNSTNGSAPTAADCLATSCRPGYQTIINSVVLSGAVGDLNIDNLIEPVTATFRKMRMDADNPRCVFWDEATNDGWGGWSDRGCSLDVNNKPEDSNVVCKCNHLTNFALLMDVYDNDAVFPEGHQIALSVISYVGCSLSLIGLVLTLITYTCCGRRSRAKTHEKQSRGDKRAKVLVNFVVSLILVNVFFIAGSLTAEYKESLVDELCMALAVCLHFSLLAAMAWMALQAFNLYMALVKVFATYYSHLLLKMMLAGWGIPVVIVGITLGVDLENYGHDENICWLSGISFYVAFLLPVCLVLIFNMVVFVAVTWKLCRLRKSKISNSDCFDLASQMRASVSITVLLGLTWVLGIFAIGEASLTINYLFAAFNSLQGFCVFVFQCLLQPEMRQRWVATCCPSCAPAEARDTKSGVYSTSRSQTNLINKPNNNWRNGTTSTAAISYAENPVYGMSEG